MTIRLINFIETLSIEFKHLMTTLRTHFEKEVIREKFPPLLLLVKKRGQFNGMRKVC